MPPRDDRPYIGIDLGGTNIGAGVVTPDGRLLNHERTKTLAEEGGEAVLGRIETLARQVLDDRGLTIGDVAGVGIGSPGAIDVKRGVVINAVNLRWNHFPLGERLGERFGLPVVVDNDVNVGTWGEFKAGAGKEHTDLLGIFVGTGIGGGLVLNGQLYHGAHQSAGEIGHIVVNADGTPGRRTLEQFAGRTSIVNLLAHMIRCNQPSLISDLVDGDLDRISSHTLAQAVEQGDPLAVETLTRAAEYVGAAIASSVTLLSLPCVVVGGGVSEALGDFWMKHVRTAFETHVFPPDLKVCQIVPGQLRGDAAIIGAGLLAHERLEQPETASKM